MHIYSLPLRTRFRGIDVREGVLIEGPAGWGEFSPFWDYDAEESANWARAALEGAHLGYPAPVRTRIPVNVTVPAVGPERAHAIAANSGGCTTAKVKVAEPGQSVGDEIARLEAVRDALGPTGAIRIDANGAWDPETAIARIALLDAAAGGLEYVEQPCPDVAGLAQVRRAVNVLIAADESIRRARDPYEVKRLGAADIVVLKVQPLGGVRACLELAAEIDMPVVVSSALESSVGLAAGIALAAALPSLPYACGLATAQLLTIDVVDSPLLPTGGAIDVRGLAPSADSLVRTQAPEDRARAWRARLAEVETVLAARGAPPLTPETGA